MSTKVRKSLISSSKSTFDAKLSLNIVLGRNFQYTLLMCPQTFQETQRWVPEQNNERRKKLGHVPYLTTLQG
jgi:hypothetical protein